MIKQCRSSWDLFYWIIAALIMIYLGFRAWYVPPFHDECATFFIYIKTGNFLPWKAFFDANNHLLNSALGTLFCRLFGDHLFVLRLASLLFFPLYAFYVYKICVLFFQRYERFVIASGLLLVHNYTEYFGYCRGYGMGLACCMALLFYLLRYLRHQRKKDLVWFSVFVPLALMSNLTLLLVVLTATCYLCIQLIRERRKAFFVFFLWNVAWVLLAIWYGSELQKSGALYYGGEQGLVADTVTSLSTLLFNNKNVWLVYLFLLPAITSLLLLPVVWMRKKAAAFFAEPVLVFSAVFWLSILAIPLMHAILKTKYPEDRTVIHLALMSFLLFFVVLKEAGLSLSVQKIFYGLVATGFLVLFCINANVQYSTFWKNEAVPYSFFEQVQKNTYPYAAYVSGYRMHAMPWAYYNYRSGKNMNPLHALNYPHQQADYIIAGDSLYTGQIRKNYKIAAREKGSGKLLLERKQSVLLVPADTFLIPGRQNFKGMYLNLAEYRDKFLADFDLCFYVSCTIRVEPQSDLHIILKSTDRNAAGNEFESMGIDLDGLHSKQGNEYVLKQRLFMPNNPPLLRDLVFFVYNPKEVVYAFSDIKVSVYRMVYP